jgi:hypothetical protein
MKRTPKPNRATLYLVMPIARRREILCSTMSVSRARGFAKGCGRRCRVLQVHGFEQGNPRRRRRILRVKKRWEFDQRGRMRPATVARPNKSNRPVKGVRS